MILECGQLLSYVFFNIDIKSFYIFKTYSIEYITFHYYSLKELTACIECLLGIECLLFYFR